MEQQECKLYEVIAIDEERSGETINPITKKPQKYIVVEMSEVSSKTVNGRKVLSGDTIGYTFNQKDEGAWIILLEKVRKGELPITELPLIEGFIHEETTPPYQLMRKNAKGELVPVELPESSEDAGLPAVGTKFRMLLKKGQDPKVAVNEFLTSNRVRLLKSIVADGGKLPTYKSSKMRDLLELAMLDEKQPEEEKI